MYDKKLAAKPLVGNPPDLPGNQSDLSGNPSDLQRDLPCAGHCACTTRSSLRNLLSGTHPTCRETNPTCRETLLTCKGICLVLATAHVRQEDRCETGRTGRETASGRTCRETPPTCRETNPTRLHDNEIAAKPAGLVGNPLPTCGLACRETNQTCQETIWKPVKLVGKLFQLANRPDFPWSTWQRHSHLAMLCSMVALPPVAFQQIF